MTRTRPVMGPLDDYLPYLLNRASARIATAFNEEMRLLGGRARGP